MLLGYEQRSVLTVTGIIWCRFKYLITWGKGEAWKSIFLLYLVIHLKTCGKGSKEAQRIPKRQSSLQLSMGDQQVNWFWTDRPVASPIKPSCLYGCAWSPWDHGWAGAERSGAGVWNPSHRDTSQLRNIDSPAAGLLSQRLAAQAGKTGARKFFCTENRFGAV